MTWWLGLCRTRFCRPPLSGVDLCTWHACGTADSCKPSGGVKCVDEVSAGVSGVQRLGARVPAFSMCCGLHLFHLGFLPNWPGDKFGPVTPCRPDRRSDSQHDHGSRTFTRECHGVHVRLLPSGNRRAIRRWCDGGFPKALGIDISKILELQRAIFADLSPAPGGIFWWPENMDLARRVRIADYLFRVTASISTNLIEAQLHLIEVRR